MEKSGIKSRLIQIWLKWILISDNHLQTRLYFKSEKAIRDEKFRHISSGYIYVIHPLSKFREWYELWLLWYYLFVVYFNSLDLAITKIYVTDTHRYMAFTVDFIAMIDVCINLITGYTIKKLKTIELRPKKIAKKYIFGPFFISDVLGSTKFLMYHVFPKPRLAIIGIQNLWSLSRVIRVWSVMQLLLKVSLLFKIKSKTTTFAICSVTLLLCTMHFFTCFLIGSKLLVRYYFQFPDPYNASMINVYDVYLDYMFRSSAILLGITLPENYVKDIQYVEDYIATVLSYVVGKILVISTWIIFALSILASKSTEIKYQRILNELEEYMIQKQLPLQLRKKINAYYHYKYHGKYFKEDLIQFIIPDNLQKNVNFEITKSLIRSVNILKKLTNQQLMDLIQALVPEIFLPNDCIIQSGTVGNSMFFINSGTVAVYTHSGKEVCHLQEGDYFGEVSLIFKGQRRLTTINAIEHSHIYKLKSSDFKRILMKNKNVYKKIVETAEKRLKYTLHLEKMYKKALFEKTYTESDTFIHHG
ncbi:potassium/sodium hyperpolarization-activated cyclic nucleotide-gated channel 2-like [Diorhabda carinulata]|uniref:potassium/sodium hyperpolarization-activated cyclic nucleotide-gated channel 2-like n=1 Tax=Diorhabda carinulata TaxID=1163345 RepID=UPI00259FF4D0|nr:potassium/sodium hyperpolarization-activated cyclic nucleotide-gated channel 2-like [Diorhabda carinulata]